MERGLLQTAALDLGITRYSTENDAQFNNRVIYSAMACWITCSAECDSACHECLMHYWNQRVHSLLDRFAALELLDWCEKSILPEELSYEQQDKLLAPLNALGADFEIIGDGMKHYIHRGGQKRRIYAYPAMWSEHSDLLPVGAITLSDKILKYALPQADAKIRNLI